MPGVAAVWGEVALSANAVVGAPGGDHAQDDVSGGAAVWGACEGVVMSALGTCAAPGTVVAVGGSSDLEFCWVMYV